MAQWRHMEKYTWINARFGNGLLHDDIKSLHEPIFLYHHEGPVTFIPLAYPFWDMISIEPAIVYLERYAGSFNLLLL